MHGIDFDWREFVSDMMIDLELGYSCWLPANPRKIERALGAVTSDCGSSWAGADRKYQDRKYRDRWAFIALPGLACRLTAMDSCFFQTGRAQNGDGGALLFQAVDSALSILRCRFDLCQCNSDGGAVWAKGWESAITDTVFVSCDCMANSHGAVGFMQRPSQDTQIAARQDVYERCLVYKCGQARCGVGMLYYTASGA
jgi:hypothetical protein